MCSIELKVYPSTGNELGYRNVAVLSPNVHPNAKYVKIGNFVYLIERSTDLEPDSILLNSLARRELQVLTDGQVFAVESFGEPFDDPQGGSEIEIIIKQYVSSRHNTYDEEQLSKLFLELLQHHVISDGRVMATHIQDAPVFFITRVLNDNNHHLPSKVVVVTSLSPKFIVEKSQNLFRDIKISDLGIGGLDAEIDYIFRRAFVSRTYDPKTIEQLGINHVKGLLLHGPPGTGKTLIARQLSKMLNCKTLKIINGPEIMDKYVGEAERKIRELFIEAEMGEKLGKKGLHVIIFDEIDSICRCRSGDASAGSKVGDNVVNQLLSKMDGVDALNNVLVIGMTNRMDLIDPALLRPGRFEIKVAISLPDLLGRQKIFEIHTKSMRNNNYLEGIDLEKLAKLTDNYTGAEITGVIKDAVSYALNRGTEEANSPDLSGESPEVKILESDFIKAINDLEPMFSRKGITGLSMEDETEATTMVPKDYQVTDNVYFVAGDNCVKTAKLLASRLGCVSNVILLSNYDLIGLDGFQKSKKIRDLVTHSLICEHTTVILTLIEEIIEYFAINGHFSVPVTGTVRTMLSRDYEGRVTFIIATRLPDTRQLVLN